MDELQIKYLKISFSHHYFLLCKGFARKGKTALPANNTLIVPSDIGASKQKIKKYTFNCPWASLMFAKEGPGQLNMDIAFFY